MVRIRKQTDLALAKARAERYAEVCVGSDLTDDEVEFGLAMEAYRREYRRPFPTCSEVLAVLKSLGYRKIETRTDNTSL